MKFKTDTEVFDIGEHTLKICTPSLSDVQLSYTKKSTSGNDAEAFPYWAQIWPSAKALAQFIEQNKALFQQKLVLEIAAGLGLPSIIASRYANHVICSDYVIEPLEFVHQTIELNNIDNITCTLINWESMPDTMQADVLILSDVNYAPAALEPLSTLIMRFLKQQTTVIIATPYRITAREFIKKLLPYCFKQEELVADEVYIHVLALNM